MQWLVRYLPRTLLILAALVPISRKCLSHPQRISWYAYQSHCPYAVLVCSAEKYMDKKWWHANQTLVRDVRKVYAACASVLWIHFQKTKQCSWSIFICLTCKNIDKCIFYQEKIVEKNMWLGNRKGQVEGEGCHHRLTPDSRSETRATRSRY